MIRHVPEVTIGPASASLLNDNLKLQSGAGFSLADWPQTSAPKAKCGTPHVGFGDSIHEGSALIEPGLHAKLGA
jgi:hypothetical protein